MTQVASEISELSQQVAAGLKKLQADKLQSELEDLQEQMQTPDFWRDNLKAQKVSQREYKLRTQLEPWQAVQHELADMAELAKDDSLEKELSEQLADLQNRYQELRRDLRFSG